MTKEDLRTSVDILHNKYLKNEKKLPLDEYFDEEKTQLDDLLEIIEEKEEKDNELLSELEVLNAKLKKVNESNVQKLKV